MPASSPSALPSIHTIGAMLDSCEARYKQLVESGVDADVACDRVFDAYDCAIAQKEMHCFDPRDRLFENRLRTIRERG